MNERRLRVNGLGFKVLDEGDGFPVVMLHGFPDTSRLWRHQIEALARAGFRCIAPDLRGRGDTDMPASVEEYRMNHQVADVVGIMDALGVERAHLIGHDWGAVVSWLTVMTQPDRFEQHVAVSVGAPGALKRRSAKMLRNFWYMFVFQFEGLAEEAFTRNDWELMREWGAGAPVPDFEDYMGDLSRPGRLTAGMNWYRANANPEQLLSESAEFPKVQAPTMGVWSDRDLALTEEQMTASERLCAGGWRYEHVTGAGHWIPTERPDELNALLLDFLKS